MNFVSEVEKTIQRPQIFALLSEINIKDKNGNEVPMFDPKNRSFPAFTFNKEGNLEMSEGFDTQENIDTYITNTSQEYANKFGDDGKIPKAIAYINGDYRNSSTYLFEKNTATALVMLFKRWAVQTISKKFGTLKRLGENEHAGLGYSALALKGFTYGVATGTVFGPAGMAAMLGIYTGYHGYKTIKNSLENDTFNIQNAQKALLNVRFNPLQKAFKSNIRLSLAVAAQSVGMIIDPLTKRQLINSDHIKKIIQLKDAKNSGEEFTPQEIREIQDDIYFLTTSIATTVKFLALRYLVMLALYPNGEEEEEHKKRVKNGDKFWERLYSDPDTAMYYLLENMLSGFIGDSNMLVNTDGLVRSGDVMGLGKFGTYKDNIEDMVKGKGDFKRGQYEGQNKFLVNLMRYNTPSVLKDGVSLGFGSKSKRDFNVDDFIDQVKKPVLEKINQARLEAYRKERKKLMESKTYSALSEKERKKVVNKIITKKFPVIKDIHMTKKGEPNKAFKSLYEHYWKE